MPTYDYLCSKCGHQFEEIQKMSDPVLTKCPKCKGKLKRLIGSGLGVIFKGSGFYVTDNRKSSAGTAGAKKDGDSAKESAAAPKDGSTPKDGAAKSGASTPKAESPTKN